MPLERVNQKLKFFSPPVCFDNYKTKGRLLRLIEFIDGYFYLGNLRSQIILKDDKSRKVWVELDIMPKSKTFKEKIQKFLGLIFKIVIFATGILPLFILLGKAVLRNSIEFFYISELKAPTFTELFKSAYYSHNFLPPINLSDAALKDDLMINHDPKVASEAEKLFKNPHLLSAFTEPLTTNGYEFIQRKNILFQNHGFKILGRKFLENKGEFEEIKYYSVLEHPKLPGWVIKSCARRSAKGNFIYAGFVNPQHEMAFFTKNEGLLRIAMSKKVKKVCDELGVKAAVPLKKLVIISDAKDIEPGKKYLLLCEKLDLLTEAETIYKIASMSETDQIKLGQTLSAIAIKAGIADLSFNNFGFTRNGELAFFDTEPTGIMKSRKQRLWKRLFASPPGTVERAARIGLSRLLSDLQYVPNTKALSNEIRHHYEKICNPTISKWKVTLSIISLGIYPLIVALNALIIRNRIENHLQNMWIKHSISAKNKSLTTEEYKAYLSEKKQDIKTWLHLTNGVPIAN